MIIQLMQCDVCRHIASDRIQRCTFCRKDVCRECVNEPVSRPCDNGGRHEGHSWGISGSPGPTGRPQ